MATVKFNQVNKIYDNKVQAVFDFNLEVHDKEFVVFVGPSGCGKSTTLRMLAGFEEITSGEILIDDVVVNEKFPKDRDIAMVFQNYALYPHMTVFNNLAFPLKMRKVPKTEIKQRVEDVAKILNLTEYLNRKPKALSGGQKQRVAVGRAIIRTPKVFLMDEPLSNLDAKLRVQMRNEIIGIHKKVGATTIYVTHDQVEAMTMADRIVVMKNGYIQQIGTPKEIYLNPANKFVASFIGSPAMNFVKGIIKNNNFEFKSCNELISLPINTNQVKSLSAYNGKEVILGVRPEHISITGKKTNNSFKINFNRYELLGSEIVIYGDMSEQNLIIKVFNIDDSINFADSFYQINSDKAVLFDAETGNRI